MTVRVSPLLTWKLRLPLLVGGVVLAPVVLGGSSPPDAMAPSARYSVESITTLTTDGSRVDWSPDGRWIAFSREGADGFFDVYRIHPDGTGEECLTCDHPELPNRHQGQPVYHPSGRYLVFQGEKAHHNNDSVHGPCGPAAGFYNDLYAMDLESRPPYDVYRLTDVREGVPVSGSLHPQFSHDGSKLLWGDLERYEPYYGDWRMAVGNFITTPRPSLDLEHAAYYDPLDSHWYETHGWGPDDSWIYFSCTSDPAMDDNAMDICRMDLANPHAVTRLTHSSGLEGEPEEWDEHAHLSPRGDVFAWTSSTPYGVQHNRDYGRWLRLEVWLMDRDGSHQRRITHFNEQGFPEYQGLTICADNSWNPVAVKRPQLAATMYVAATHSSHIKIIQFAVDDADRPHRSP